MAAPKHSLTENWKEEDITPFFMVSSMVGTAAIVLLIVAARLSAYAYIGVVGVFTIFQWMPYLMAYIYYNTDEGDMFSGLYKKLAYAPLPAPLPKWVKRCEVAQNNAYENFFIFAIGLIFSFMMGVEEKDVRVPAIFYFGCRVYYYVFTVSPPIFMMKTACWFMGWGACAYIFIKSMDTDTFRKYAYDL